VHQIFDIMVDAAKKKNAKLFLCAGGVLIHYLGDACQPLHASYMANGDPEVVVPRPKSEGNRMEAEGVHVGYEDDMIAHGYTKADLGSKLHERIAELKAKEEVPDIVSGYDAAKAVIALIHATQSDIAPRQIVDEWVSLLGVQKKARAEALWKKFGNKTVTCMARGTRYLAKIWQAAWEVGGGDEKAIMDLYKDSKVIPSVGLNQYPDDVRSDWSKIVRPDPQQPSVSSARRSVGSGRATRPARKAKRRGTAAKKKTPATAKKKKKAAKR
jgi:hypothetical protein